MRLREPFNGYRLSSGHFQFHMAFLIASRIALNILGVDRDGKPFNVYDANPKAKDVLF